MQKDSKKHKNIICEKSSDDCFDRAMRSVEDFQATNSI